MIDSMTLNKTPGLVEQRKQTIIWTDWYDQQIEQIWKVWQQTQTHLLLKFPFSSGEISNMLKTQ